MAVTPKPGRGNPATAHGSVTPLSDSAALGLIADLLAQGDASRSEEVCQGIADLVRMTGRTIATKEQ